MTFVRPSLRDDCGFHWNENRGFHEPKIHMFQACHHVCNATWGERPLLFTYCCGPNHWRIQGVYPARAPLRVPILSLWHTNFTKRSCVGSPRPPTGNYHQTYLDTILCQEAEMYCIVCLGFKIMTNTCMPPSKTAQYISRK